MPPCPKTANITNAKQSRRVLRDLAHQNSTMSKGTANNVTSNEWNMELPQTRTPET